MPLTVAFLVKNGHPLNKVSAAARSAALKEATFQLGRLEALDLAREPPENRVRVARWCRELRQLIDLRRRA